MTSQTQQEHPLLGMVEGEGEGGLGRLPENKDVNEETDAK